MTYYQDAEDLWAVHGSGLGSSPRLYSRGLAKYSLTVVVMSVQEGRGECVKTAELNQEHQVHPSRASSSL